MTNFTPARGHVLAVLVALTAFLFARSWLQVVLRERGIDWLHAADLSYLIAWPVLLLLLLPVLHASGDGIRSLFDRSGFSMKIALRAVAVGLLIRLAWWCQLIAGISFGIYSSSDASAVVGPQFVFQCPRWSVAALGILVMAILMPVTEELVHRGFIQSALYRFGPLAAIIGSAIVFTVFHPPGGWPFVFLAGVVLGIQFWVTKSLWASLITHATINGLIQFDWRCLRGSWNPPTADVPIAIPGTIAAFLLVACSVTILAILWQMHRGDLSPR